MTLRVAVLGCGPSGLAAFHAVNIALGREGVVHAYSRKRRSHLHGAQYLHKPIPHLPEAVGADRVTSSLTGSVADYRRKVYGDTRVNFTSVEILLGEHQAWDIRASYEQLWNMYSPLVSDTEIDAQQLRSLADKGLYDLIINTLPLDQLCIEGHQFTSQNIYAKGSTAPDWHNDGSVNTVLCNGEESPGWYRYSSVFGYQTWEWPGGKKPPVEDVVPWVKPIKHNCTCWPWESTKILHVGRYGAWSKGYLVHRAYYYVSDVVNDMARHGFSANFDPNDAPFVPSLK